MCGMQQITFDFFNKDLKHQDIESTITSTQKGIQSILANAAYIVVHGKDKSITVADHPPP